MSQFAEDLKGGTSLMSLYAQNVHSEDWRPAESGIKDNKDLRSIKDIKDIKSINDIKDVSPVSSIKDINNIKDIKDTKDIKDIVPVSSIKDTIGKDGSGTNTEAVATGPFAIADFQR